jgi:hypothetical protein
MASGLGFALPQRLQSERAGPDAVPFALCAGPRDLARSRKSGVAGLSGRNDRSPCHRGRPGRNLAARSLLIELEEADLFVHGHGLVIEHLGPPAPRRAGRGPSCWWKSRSRHWRLPEPMTDRGCRLVHPIRRLQQQHRVPDHRIKALPTARKMTDDHRTHARVPMFLQMIDDADEGLVVALTGKNFSDLIGQIDRIVR